MMTGAGLKTFKFLVFPTGALLVERPAAVEEGFSQQAPLVYHYGHKSTSTNLALYNMLVSRLAEVISERMQANRKGKLMKRDRMPVALILLLLCTVSG
jgi:hypothetical protein